MELAPSWLMAFGISQFCQNIQRTLVYLQRYGREDLIVLVENNWDARYRNIYWTHRLDLNKNIRTRPSWNRQSKCVLIKSTRKNMKKWNRQQTQISFVPAVSPSMCCQCKNGSVNFRCFEKRLLLATLLIEKPFIYLSFVLFIFLNEWPIYERFFD